MQPECSQTSAALGLVEHLHASVLVSSSRSLILAVFLLFLSSPAAVRSCSVVHHPG